MRSLNAYIDKHHVGTLHEGDDIWRFDYNAQWAQASHGFDLAPGLPRSTLSHLDGSTTRPVQWFFDNLLPEELLRQAISKEASIKGDDAFALLEYLGAESAGSLTLLPPGQPLPQSAMLRALPDEQLNARIQALPHQTLTAVAPKRMSLAGAQNKLLVVYRDGKLYEPEGATASTHILKPAHPDTNTYPASVINEYVSMRLAAAAGLTVPAVHVHEASEPVYIVERFDRHVQELGQADNGTPHLAVQRRHIIDACQLLNRARTFKHSGASLQALRDIIQQTTNKAAARVKLFRWLVFNIVLANDDCHLKNLSFFVSAQGIEVAPHYDLLATSAYYTKAFADEKAIWDAVPMAIALPGAKLFSEVTAKAVLQAGIELGLTLPTGQRILREVTTRLAAALPAERANLERLHANRAVGHACTAAEIRFMRVLDSIIMADMFERLRA